jgi:hypothetical protein
LKSQRVQIPSGPQLSRGGSPAFQPNGGSYGVQAKGNKHCGYLLDNPQVNRWYENVARGSLVTSQERFRRMGFVSEQFKGTPSHIAKMDKKQASDFLLDIIGTLERSNRLTSIVRRDSGGAATVRAPRAKTLPCVIVNEVGRFSREFIWTSNKLYTDEG